MFFIYLIADKMKKNIIKWLLLIFGPAMISGGISVLNISHNFPLGIFMILMGGVFVGLIPAVCDLPDKEEENI